MRLAAPPRPSTKRSSRPTKCDRPGPTRLQDQSHRTRAGHRHRSAGRSRSSTRSEGCPPHLDQPERRAPKWCFRALRPNAPVASSTSQRACSLWEARKNTKNHRLERTRPRPREASTGKPRLAPINLLAPTAAVGVVVGEHGQSASPKKLTFAGLPRWTHHSDRQPRSIEVETAQLGRLSPSGPLVAVADRLQAMCSDGPRSAAVRNPTRVADVPPEVLEEHS